MLAWLFLELMAWESTNLSRNNRLNLMTIGLDGIF